MGALLLAPGAEELEGGIGADDRAAIRHVGNQPVDVDRVPQEIVDRGPGVPVEYTRRIHGRRAHHEGRPRIGQEHQQATDRIEQQPEGQVHPFLVPALEPVPAVIVDVKNRALGEEQQRVRKHAPFEDGGQILEQIGIEEHQAEGQQAAENGGERVGNDADLHEFESHVVIALIPGRHADGLDDEHEYRHRQNKSPEPEMQLRHQPHRHAGIHALDGGVVRGG